MTLIYFLKKVEKSIAFYVQCFYNTIIGNVTVTDTDTDTETVTVERYEVHIMRTSGILLPVASLPSKYGIGAFSKEAYKFVAVSYTHLTLPTIA